MKKIKIILLLFLIIPLSALFGCADDKGNIKPTPSPSSSPIVTPGTITLESFTADIMENPQAIYIGNYLLYNLKCNGVTVDASKYLIRNNHFIFLEGFYYEVGLGEHILQFNFKEGTQEITLTVTDTFKAEYELPQIDNYVYPLSSFVLPSVKRKNDWQQLDITYKVTKGGADCIVTLTEGGIAVDADSAGDYVYNIEIKRHGQVLENINYNIKAVTDEDFGTIIDNTVSNQFSDVWSLNYIDSNISYVNQVTDDEGITKSALKYENKCTASTTERMLLLDRETILNAYKKGYKKISFWAYTQQERVFLRFDFYNSKDGAKFSQYPIPKGVWTKFDYVFSAVGITEEKLYYNLYDLKLGILTFRMEKDTQTNEDIYVESTVYISDVKVIDNSESIDSYAGAYDCEDGDRIIIDDSGNAEFLQESGKTYASRISNGHIFLTRESENLEGFISSGLIFIKDKLFASNVSLEYNSGLTVPLYNMDILKIYGYDIEYSIKKDQTTTQLESLNYVFDFGSDYEYIISIKQNGLVLSQTVLPIILTESCGINYATQNALQYWSIKESGELFYYTSPTFNGFVFNNGGWSDINTGTIRLDSAVINSAIDAGFNAINIKAAISSAAYPSTELRPVKITGDTYVNILDPLGNTQIHFFNKNVSTEIVNIYIYITNNGVFADSSAQFGLMNTSLGARLLFSEITFVKKDYEIDFEGLNLADKTNFNYWSIQSPGSFYYNRVEYPLTLENHNDNTLASRTIVLNSTLINAAIAQGYDTLSFMACISSNAGQTTDILPIKLNGEDYEEILDDNGDNYRTSFDKTVSTDYVQFNIKITNNGVYGGGSGDFGICKTEPGARLYLKDIYFTKS